MKKIFLLTLLSTLLFASCNSDECTVDIEEPLCETQDLEIDELSKFSYLEYIVVDDLPMIDHSDSYRWEWKISNDTIEIAGDIGSGGEGSLTAHMFFKKNIDNCIDLLFTRKVAFDDGGVIFDSDTGEIIEHGFTWFEFNDLDFTIQEYIEDEVLIGRIGGVDFWMEFTPDTHRLIPYDYEQYL